MALQVNCTWKSPCKVCSLCLLSLHLHTNHTLCVRCKISQTNWCIWRSIELVNFVVNAKPSMHDADITMSIYVIRNNANKYTYQIRATTNKLYKSHCQTNGDNHSFGTLSMAPHQSWGITTFSRLKCWISIIVSSALPYFLWYGNVLHDSKSDLTWRGSFRVCCWLFWMSVFGELLGWMLCGNGATIRSISGTLWSPRGYVLCHTMYLFIFMKTTLTGMDTNPYREFYILHTIGWKISMSGKELFNDLHYNHSPYIYFRVFIHRYVRYVSISRPSAIHLCIWGNWMDGLAFNGHCPQTYFCLIVFLGWWFSQNDLLEKYIALIKKINSPVTFTEIFFMFSLSNKKQYFH